MKHLGIAFTVGVLLGVDPALAWPMSSGGAVFGAVAEPAAAGSEARVPKSREYSSVWDQFENSLVRPVTRVLDAPRLARQVTRNRREAANVDAQDQVRLPSTWWQPRLGFRPVSVAQMLKGPGGTTGPARGRWTITSAKTQGVTPGFNIKDARGDKFILKFDPPGSPELVTSVDVVGSHLLWAAGYNVPENTIAVFHPDSLDIAPDAAYKVKGKDSRFTREDLTRVLARAHRRPDGTVRCVASRFLAGKPLGPFKYVGLRTDDPEDLVPHELRRELRGLWPIAAWLNHTDIRGPNSLDMWVTDGGRSFVRHYLIDFGSILGSSAVGPRSGVAGTEYYVDCGVIGRQLVTLGLAPFRWESAVNPEIPSVGFVEAVQFDPRGWRPDYPNPAFDERTVRDIRWGVRIIAGFTDAHIRAAIDAAGYSDPHARDYLTSVLAQRRDKLVRTWLHPAGEVTGVPE